MPELLPPQLVVNSRMMFLSYLPAEPAAIAEALPAGLGLTPVKSRAVVLVHYVVDRDEQTSGFGAYSLSYICFDVVDHDADPETPGRWFSHYFISSPRVRDYAIARGIPATDGETTLEFEGDTLVATAVVDGRPLIRSRARTSGEVGETTGGQLMVLSALDGRVMRNRHAVIMERARDFEMRSISFLDPTHSVHPFRPKEPLELVFGFHAPRASFCYPGGIDAA